MKRINLKIFLAIVACSCFGILFMGITNLIIGAGVARESALEELVVIVEREGHKLEGQLASLEHAVSSLDEIVVSTVVERHGGSFENVVELKNDLLPLLKGMAGRFELVDLALYFDPELYKGGHLELVDRDRDGIYRRATEINLSELPPEDEIYLNYKGTVAALEEWSAPYYPDSHKINLISYRRALKVGDRVIGVIGASLAVDDIISYFHENVVMKSGGMFLYDSELTFIIHKSIRGQNLKDVDPAVYAKMVEKIERIDGDKHIDYRYKGVSKTLVYEVLANGWVLAIAITNKEFLDKLAAMVRAFIIFLIIITLISVLSAYFVGNSISRPILLLSGNMKSIATGDGDLTQKMNITVKDEIGILAEHFNSFVDKLRGIVINVRDSAGNDRAIGAKLQDAVSHSSNAIGRISTGLNSIRGQLISLDSNIFDSTASIEEVSANISSINDQVESQGAAVTQSTTAIEEMIASLNSVVKVTQRKLEAIEQLTGTVRDGGEQLRYTNETFESGIVRRIGEITEMVKVINSISAQTNLLAMNASIEAAHAGESGRGFAVVAEEIRAMAETSSESARNISSIISQIVESVRETAESAQKTAGAFVEIEREVVDFRGAFQEIASSTSEISIGGNEILSAIGTLNQVTGHIQNGIGEIDRAAVQVRASMLDVKEISAAGLQGIHEIHEGTGYVEQSIGRVSTQADELAKGTELLLNELNRFKT